MSFQNEVGHNKRARSFAMVEKEDVEEEYHEPPRKRSKIADLEALHADYVAKHHAREEARVLWRNAMNSLQCLRDPSKDDGDKQ